MKNVIYTCLSALWAAALLLSCTKQDPVTPKPKPDPSTLADFYPASVYKWGLKDLARACDLLIGAEFTYGEYGQDDSLKVVLKRDFDATVFGNEMKHDCVVRRDGSLNFSQVDQMVRWVHDCGLQLFGHTLGWHSQQQRDYLDSLIAGAPDAETAASLVREAHKKWVDEMVAHCDVYGWDVVNEVLTDAGTWRTQNDVQDGYHVFLWGQYYPGGTKEFVDQAFRNAREALEREGKTADLYINDYNLEWSQAKVEALCKYAEGNPDVTGVGSQMHISSDVNRDNVRSMLERMVRTGKKVRISELDVSLGNTNQGETIVYIFDQYLKMVPKDQRGGITFWGVSDKNSWLGADKQPLLYSKAYLRKDSYLKLHAYLLERSGLQ
jgi:GH35 family endo-1,4-beta-xylanase